MSIQPVPSPDVSAAKRLWTPDPARVAASNMDAFRRFVSARHDLTIADSTALHVWSVTHIPAFWDAVWDFCAVIGDKGARLLDNSDTMPGAQFFPDARLNYAENLLLPRANPDDTALVFWGEDKVKRRVSFVDLQNRVSQLQQFFQTCGLKTGDRVAALMPNTPETLIAMLAATSLGLVWSSASPDFGVQGVLDRFGQIEPKILIATDGYFYNGKWIDCREKITELLPHLPSLQATLLVPYDPAQTPEPLMGTMPWDTVLSDYTPSHLHFERVAFQHPLFIMFSSGTTGKPKCIVHGTGGPLLQLLKEHRLHCDIKPGDNIFYFTTCGWMMWNWLMTALASEANVCLYDGSPFAGKPDILFDYADAENISLLGVGAKYIDALHKQHITPKATHRLEKLRTITSTGSPLVAEGFTYVYDKIKDDVHLASISGGTDIVSCFVLGDPTRPVFCSEIQGPGLGLAMDVYTIEGTQAAIGEKGELVCTQPFPCMPVAFWNDADGSKYHKAYFDRFAGVWHHGDFAEKTAHGGYIIHGRSDATLKPSGVRIGTAEIYAQVEHLDEVLESVAVGQKWHDDERVILFVILQPGLTLDEILVAKIKKQIRIGASPHHVPAKIIQVSDIPRTKNNKISEIAVRDTISGLGVANLEALANPEALALYRNLSDLQAP